MSRNTVIGNEPTAQKVVAETFPLRKNKGHPEVLLVSFQEIKELMEEKIGFMCESVPNEQKAVLVVKKALKNQENQPFYKYIIADLDDGTMIFERFAKTLSKLLENIQVKLYAFSAYDSEKLQTQCKNANFIYFKRPDDFLDTLKHMAESDESLSRASDDDMFEDDFEKAIKSKTPQKESPQKESPLKESPLKESPLKETLQKESPLKESPLKETLQKESGKKAPPMLTKKFEEDILEDDDWLLTKGEELKQLGLIQPDDPDRIKKMQEEDVKQVQNNIQSATSYIDGLLSSFKPKSVKFEEGEHLSPQKTTKDYSQTLTPQSSPSIPSIYTPSPTKQDAYNRRMESAQKKQQQLEDLREQQKQINEAEMARQKELSSTIAPDAFYATGNALIATQANPEAAEELLVIEKQKSKTQKHEVNPFKIEESVGYSISSKEPLVGNFLEVLDPPAPTSGSDFQSTRQVGFRSENSLKSEEPYVQTSDKPSDKPYVSSDSVKSVESKPTMQVIVDLFETIAQGETQIERMRQQLASNAEFDPKLLFSSICNDSHTISAPDLQEYMFDNSLRGGTEKVCSEIITEFDGDLDKNLSFEEFLNIFLPAANESLRNYCLFHNRRRHTPYNPSLAATIACRILQIEIEMASAKLSARKTLSNAIISDIFNEISGRKKWINLQDLTNFLEFFNFYPSASDLEAILRRCDHDADRKICYEEFHELLQAEITYDAPECKKCVVKEVMEKIREKNKLYKIKSLYKTSKSPELLQVLTILQEDVKELDLDLIWSLLDSNRQGFVTVVELIQWLENPTDTKIITECFMASKDDVLIPKAKFMQIMQ